MFNKNTVLNQCDFWHCFVPTTKSLSGLKRLNFSLKLYIEFHKTLSLQISSSISLLFGRYDIFVTHVTRDPSVGRDP